MFNEEDLFDFIQIKRLYLYMFVFFSQLARQRSLKRDKYQISRTKKYLYKKWWHSQGGFDTFNNIKSLIQYNCLLLRLLPLALIIKYLVFLSPSSTSLSSIFCNNLTYSSLVSSRYAGYLTILAIWSSGLEILSLSLLWLPSIF